MSDGSSFSSRARHLYCLTCVKIVNEFCVICTAPGTAQSDKDRGACSPTDWDMMSDNDKTLV